MLVYVKVCSRGVDVPDVFILDVLNCTASFDGANGEACRVGKTAHYPCLPLQGTGDRLVDCRRVTQVDHVNVSLRSRNDKQLVLDIHAIHALSRIQGANGLRTLQVPKLDRLIPRPSRNVVFAACLEPAHAFYGLRVGLGLLGWNLAAGRGGAEVNNV